MLIRLLLDTNLQNGKDCMDGYVDGWIDGWMNGYLLLFRAKTT